MTSSSVPESVCSLAGAVFVADESIEAQGTEAVLAAGALEALVAQAGPVDVVALGSVLAVTLVGTLRPVSADWALVLASGGYTYNKGGVVRRGLKHMEDGVGLNVFLGKHAK